LGEVAAEFRKETGRDVRITYAASGTLVNQIQNGAPFQAFLSADEAFVAHLVRDGLTKDAGTVYATGRIVLFAPTGAPLMIDTQLNGLQAALAAGSVRRFAIPNPEFAPYGRAARAALERAGLWLMILPRLVFAEDASQAAQFAASGAAQGGIIALSLANAAEVSKLGTFAVIPADLHPGESLKQRMVLLKGAGDTATAFYEFVQRPNARSILMRYGFVVPSDQ
jgi:molybdate transport system substrate-binding protein